MRKHRVLESHHWSNRYRDGRCGSPFVQSGGRGDGDSGGRDTGRGGHGSRGGGGDTYANERLRQSLLDEIPVTGTNSNIIRDMLCFCCNRYEYGRQLCTKWCENSGTREVGKLLTRSLLFNNVVKEFLLEHNIYLIDCAVSHFTVNSLGNIINLTNSNDIGFDKKGDLDFLPLKPYVNYSVIPDYLNIYILFEE